MKKILILLIFTTFTIALNAQKNNGFPQEILKVYYQNWVGGQELSGSGTDFYIEFKNPLQENLNLLSLFFRKQEAKLEKISETTYIARFLRPAKMVYDDSGNRTVVHETGEDLNPKYVLLENEAVLEYKKSDKKIIYKLKNIAQKENIAYP